MPDQPLVIQPLGPEQRPTGPGWTPREGLQTRSVLERALRDPAARAQVLDSAADILGRGISSQQRRGIATGLVVGYVQSGKTLSFTAAIGMARDNGFPLVIVIAGTKTSLLRQSTDRLERDLDTSSDDGVAAWRLLKNPSEQDAATIRQCVAEWSDPDADEDDRPTLVLTVLKQRHRLEALIEVLAGIELEGVPALVIDDEADQASLNTKVRKGEESATYTWLRQLRRALPLHTYLQYTATPQAPLLINIASVLSPDFVHVLRPGDGYVGGSDFFAEGSPYVEAIPAHEVFPDDEVPDGPPPSLLSAMRVFFVGLAAALAAGDGDGGRQRRSMLMHPSRVRAVHAALTSWAKETMEQWQTTLSLDESDPDKEELVAEFREAYVGLLMTEPTLVAFDLIMEKMRRALRKTQVIEFNAREQPTTPEIQWKHARGWILVGGQAVDRGFTVSDLTVTYMPRGLGMGNADAVQQRARFFGYKRRYLGLCRIYLEQATIDAFRSYVEHEETMRVELERVAIRGEPLSSWKRRFILSDDMRLCRDSVIALGDEYVRGTSRGEWTQQRDAQLTEELREGNAEAVARFAAACRFVPDATYVTRLAAQRHVVANRVPLEQVIEFLLDYRLPHPEDTLAITGVLLQIQHVARNSPGATAAVYRMRPNYRSTRGRTVDENGLFPKGFLQGRTADGRSAYPGDTFFSSPDRISLQLHSLRLKHENGTLISEAAPLIAVRVPREVAPGWIVQTQGGFAE